MFKSWLSAVFWGNAARNLWTVGSIIATVFSLTPWASAHQVLRLLVPLSLFTAGFFVSNFFLYSGMKQELDRVTGALTLRKVQVQAGEHCNTALQRHTIVIEMPIEIRNQSSDGNSLKVEGCTVDIAGASLESLQFLGKITRSFTQEPGPTWNIPGKSQDEAVVNAAFIFPYTPTPIVQDLVNGVVTIVDIHDRVHELQFSTSLIRNPRVENP